MTGNIEFECAAQCDIENLKPLADRQNRQTARHRFLHRLKFPAVALWIDVFINHVWVRNLLA